MEGCDPGTVNVFTAVLIYRHSHADPERQTETQASAEALFLLSGLSKNT